MRLPSSRSRRLVFVTVYLVFCWLLVVGATRVYWFLAAAVPLTQTPSVWDQFYPRLRIAGLADRPCSRSDDRFDLLLLGGSVLDTRWGTVEEELRQRLEQLLPGRHRICNLAQAGFTSRDSLLQYEHLDRSRFDLVVVYDGINDVRLNCCPPELFQDDYTHSQWYADFVRRRAGGAPSLANVATDRVTSVFHPSRLGTPDPELLDYAATPQSPRTVRKNLERVSRLAEERHDPLLLLTFAWHLPPDYTLEKFSAGELDYAPQAEARCAAELWGRPADVARTMELQNAAIRELARENPAARFLDLDAKFPRTGVHFVDPCHLTPAGCVRFVEILWPEIERAARRSPAGRVALPPRT